MAERPAYWSPEYLLEELREGRKVAEILRQAREDLGLTEPDETPTERSLWNDVWRWRKTISGWDEKYQAAMVDCYEKREETFCGAAIGSNQGDFGPRLQHAFFAAMAENEGDMTLACYDIGVSPSVVLTRIDPKSPNYDPKFHDTFTVHEAARNAKIYEMMYDRALSGESDWLLHKVAESRLPHIFNAKKTIELQGYIRHDHGALPAAVTRQLAHQSRAFAAPQAELEGDVVDAEVVEEPA